MSLFPSSLPAVGSASTTATLAAAGHTALHNNDANETVAIATKVGTGASTPVSNTILGGTGTGTSSWRQLDLNNDTTGVLGTSKGGTGGVTTLLGLVYPLGCIYTETTGVNPGTTFGFGTWVAFGAGRVLVGNGNSDQVFSAGSTGGESNHLLSSTEMPSHTHTDSGHTHTVGDGSGFVSGGATGSAASVTQTGAAFRVNVNTTSSSAVLSNTGGGSSHNNLQPYIVVYFWQRTA